MQILALLTFFDSKIQEEKYMTLKYEFKKANVNNRLDPANDNTKVQTLGK